MKKVRNMLLLVMLLTVFTATAAWGEEMTETTTSLATEETVSDTETDALTEDAASDETTADAASDEALSALEEEILNDSSTLSCLVNGEKWFVEEEFGQDIMWNSFVITTRFYKGVEVCASKLNNAEYYLVLVKSEDGTSEKFVVYDQDEKTFTDVEKIEYETGDAFYIIEPAEEDIPSYFEETTYEEHRAWQVTSNTSYPEYAADPSDYYILYGYNSEGDEGWYLFDSETGTYSRYVELMSAATEGTDAVVSTDSTSAQLSQKYDNLLSRFNFLVTCIKYVAIALIALLLILLIVNLSEKSDSDDDKKKQKKNKKKNKKKQKYDADTDEPAEPKAAVKKAAAKAEPTAAKTAAKAKPAAAKTAAKAEPTATKTAAAKAKPAAAKTAAKAEPTAAKTEAKAKPAAEASTNKSIQDSIEELSRQIQSTMREENKQVDLSGLEDLTFIDLDDE